MPQNKISLHPAPLQPVKRWPKSMPELKPLHFEHGTWTGEIDDHVEYGIPPQDIENLDHKLSKLTTCGTPRCAVGNVLSAFGLDCRYSAWRNSGLEAQVQNGEGPVGKFVATYASKLTGKKYNRCSLERLSDIFEGSHLSRYVTAEQAASAWNDTLNELGYTEEVYA